MRTLRKRAAARKRLTPVRDEVTQLRRHVEQLQTEIHSLRKSAADLHRGYEMTLRRFGEVQIELDTLKKTRDS